MNSSSNRTERAMEIFDHVCDLPDADRKAAIEDACGDDLELRAEVESLLRYDRDSGKAIDAAEAGEGVDALMATVQTSSGELPQQIGAYKIIRKIGEGGMGEVFEAEQESPKRRVALKIIRSGRLSRQLVRRFEHEAFVLGQLQHPGIAHIYESGVVDVDGASQPFFAMEFIDGVRITQYADAQAFSIRQRLSLMARVCDAVQHAHQKGIIHRDLKPANILVVEHGTTLGGDATGTKIDVSGQPKILDFGIARMTDGDIQAATIQTEVGQIVGTLSYMSPEQVAGDSSKLDTRCDVYALGVVLYQLLTDRLPLDVSDRSIAEIARVIHDDEPALAGTINKALRGDIETILAKALEKDPSRRYESAAQLASDIRRYLQDEPIAARPASAGYQLRKFARRNKGLVGGLLTTFAALVIGLIGTAYFLIEANQQRAEATRKRDDAIAAREEADQERLRTAAVAEFQSSQLTGIDVPRLGLRLRSDLLESIEEDRKSSLEAELGSVNFTDLARTTLERNIFGRSIETVDTQFAEQPLLRARLLQELASTMRQLGSLTMATDPQQRALDIKRRELGNEHIDTIRTLIEQGLLQHALGNYAVAEEVFREASQTSQRVFGDDHRVTLKSMANVSSILIAQSKFDAAESMARAVRDRLLRIAGPDDPETLGAISTLAAALEGKGEPEEAEELCRDVLTRRRLTLGADHPQILAAISDLAVLLEQRGEYEEAKSLYKDALTIRRRTLGDDHPDTIESMQLLGTVLSNLGKLEDAEQLQQDALSRRRRLLGNHHPQTLDSINSVAAILDQQGKFEAAERLYRESLAGHRRVLGEDHQRTLMAANNLGFILNQLDRPREAEPLYRETLAGLRRIYGDDHPTTLSLVNNLATLLTDLGKDNEAEPLYYESLEGRRKRFGNDHPSTLIAIYNMGDMFRLKGMLDKAEPFCVQALEGYRRVGGEDHIGTLYSLTQLGNLRMDQDRPADAELFFQEAVARRRRINGDDHPETLHAVVGLAAAQEAQDRWSDAETWRRFLCESALRSPPTDDGGVAGKFALLGRNLLKQGRWEEAESELAKSLSSFEESTDGNNWRRHEALSIFGLAIANDPDRRIQAEQHLLEAARQCKPPPNADRVIKERIETIRMRLYQFYESTGQLEKAEAARKAIESRL